MATGDLTTLASVKAYLHIPTSNTTQDSFLSALITQVTLRIQKDCQRNFAAANYLEFQNTGTGATRCQVRNKPIIQVYRVGWGYASAIQLTYTGTAVSAIACIRPDRSFQFETIGSGGLAQNSIDLTSVSYSLCSQVVTQINTFSGWLASLYGGLDVPTRWLLDSINMNCRSSGENFTQGVGYAPIDVFNYQVDPTYGTIGFQPLTTSDYFFQPEGKSITPIAFPGMYQGLLLDYRGGYETIPGDIDLLCQQIVADTYNLSLKDGNLSQESLGDYAYTMIDPMLRRSYYADILAPYRRIAVAGGMS